MENIHRKMFERLLSQLCLRH